MIEKTDDNNVAYHNLKSGKYPISGPGQIKNTNMYRMRLETERPRSSSNGSGNGSCIFRYNNNNNKYKTEQDDHSSEYESEISFSFITIEDRRLISLVNKLIRFKDILFNKSDETLRNIFYLINFIMLIEYLIISYIDNSYAKFAVNFIFFIPIIIFFIENENFMRLQSYFEVSFICTMKLLLTFGKSLNYFEIILTAILLNLFEVRFIKNCYCRLNDEDYLDQGKNNQKLLLINRFRFDFKFLVLGYLINAAWLLYISKRFNFLVFDESKKFYIYLYQYFPNLLLV